MQPYLRPGLFFLCLLFMIAEGKAQPARRSTANSRVQVLDTAFYMPQLKRHRRIWICLPKNYTQTNTRYPVLYLQDGQNLFDAATSFSGEWGIDEAMDSLGPSFGECIVVGIDNGGDKRLSEYSPANFSLDNGKLQVTAAGDAYVDFLVRTLRPYLQRNYRVQRNRRAHFIAGSSMGGLIAYHAVLRYPKKWGGAGIFSPAFWVVRQPLLDATRQRGGRVRCPLYFYAGQQESTDMVPDMLSLVQTLDATSRAKITTVIRAEGRHSEAAWQQEFPIFYEWMMTQQ